MATTSKPPLPQRVRKTPVTSGVHLAEEVLRKYERLADGLKQYLDLPEVLLLDDEVQKTRTEVEQGIGEIAEEVYGGDHT